MFILSSSLSGSTFLTLVPPFELLEPVLARLVVVVVNVMCEIGHQHPRFALEPLDGWNLIGF